MAVMRGGSAAGTPPEGEPQGHAGAVVTFTADHGIACHTEEMPELDSDLRHDYCGCPFGIIGPVGYGFIEAYADAQSYERIHRAALPEIVMTDDAQGDCAVTLCPPAAPLSDFLPVGIVNRTPLRHFAPGKVHLEKYSAVNRDLRDVVTEVQSQRSAAFGVAVVITP